MNEKKAEVLNGVQRLRSVSCQGSACKEPGWDLCRQWQLLGRSSLRQV